MLIELATDGGEVVLTATEIGHRPAAGDVIALEGKDWVIRPDAPRSRRETVTGGLQPREEWVTRFVVAAPQAATATTRRDPRENAA